MIKTFYLHNLWLLYGEEVSFDFFLSMPILFRRRIRESTSNLGFGRDYQLTLDATGRTRSQASSRTWTTIAQTSKKRVSFRFCSSSPIQTSRAYLPLAKGPSLDQSSYSQGERQNWHQSRLHLLSLARGKSGVTSISERPIQAIRIECLVSSSTLISRRSCARRIYFCESQVELVRYRSDQP